LDVNVAPWLTSDVIAHVQLLLDSFQHWSGQDLLMGRQDPLADAQQLFVAPYVVLSHGVESDPVINYGNQTALQLWEMDWADFTQMPSRLTAEPDLRTQRSQLLAQAAQQGYLTDYEGVRVSQTGQRFLIQQATIWQLRTPDGQVRGQAATFDHWQRL
jgi:hypothetical protein